MSPADHPDPQPRWTILWPEGSANPAWSHSGIAVLPGGEVAFAEPGGGAVIILDESTGVARRVPTPTQDNHGILLGDDGVSLWLADPGSTGDLGGDGQVLHLDLASERVTAVPQPKVSQYSEASWRPTSIALGPNNDESGSVVWVADGYGQSLIHRYAPSGEVTTLDGSSSGLAFDCPHGIVWDDRAEPQLVVADRNNRRLVFLTPQGEFIRELRDDLITSPSSLSVRGDELVVTELDGALLGVSGDGSAADVVRAIVPRTGEKDRPGWPNAIGAGGDDIRPEVIAGQLNSPHGVAVGADGQIYLTEWFFGGRQIRLDLPASTV